VNFNTAASRVVCCKRFNAFRLALARVRSVPREECNTVLTWTHVPGYFPPTGETFHTEVLIFTGLTSRKYVLFSKYVRFAFASRRVRT
jgi:hypothetical protein